jgi:hypothetical protein
MPLIIAAGVDGSRSPTNATIVAVQYDREDSGSAGKNRNGWGTGPPPAPECQGQQRGRHNRFTSIAAVIAAGQRSGSPKKKMTSAIKRARRSTESDMLVDFDPAPAVAVRGIGE